MRKDRTNKLISAVPSEGSATSSPTECRISRLRALADRLDETHGFVKGQCVKWKPGLKNKKFPDYGEPVIVTAVLPAPIIDPDETSGSPYFRESLSIVIGVERDDDFLEFYADGRRFEPFEA